jgi:large subunit ribosomal protein L28
VDRNGGIDAYLLKIPNAKLPHEALVLKRRIQKAQAKAEKRAG